MVEKGDGIRWLILRSLQVHTQLMDWALLMMATYPLGYHSTRHSAGSEAGTHASETSILVTTIGSLNTSSCFPRVPGHPNIGSLQSRKCVQSNVDTTSSHQSYIHELDVDVCRPSSPMQCRIVMLSRPVTVTGQSINGAMLTDVVFRCRNIQWLRHRGQVSCLVPRYRAVWVGQSLWTGTGVYSLLQGDLVCPTVHEISVQAVSGFITCRIYPVLVIWMGCCVEKKFQKDGIYRNGMRLGTNTLVIVSSVGIRHLQVLSENPQVLADNDTYMTLMI